MRGYGEVWRNLGGDWGGTRNKGRAGEEGSKAGSMQWSVYSMITTWKTVSPLFGPFLHVDRTKSA